MIGRPDVEIDGPRVAFTWKDQHVGIAFDYLNERTDGLHGEIRITAIDASGRATGHIHWARINLSSTTARKSLVDVITKQTRHDDGECPYDWPQLAEYACTVAAQKYREGEPFIDLADVPRPPRMQYLVEKLLPKGKTSVIYSRGASGKSLLSLSIAMGVSRGRSLPSGLVVQERANVLYLDYETDEEEQRLRLDYLWRALKNEPLPSVRYRRQTRMLMNDIDQIKREVKRQQIGLVVVDSIAYAMAGKAIDTEVVIGSFNALSSLGPECTRLVIAHIPKADKESKEATIFGNVFQENGARSIWELRSTDENDGISMGLFQRKQNWGKKFDPIGLRFTFDDVKESVELKSHVIEDDPELVAHGSLSYRLLSALRTGVQSTSELAEAAGDSRESVTRTLRRLAERGTIVRFESNGKGRGQEQRWGLTYAAEVSG